MEKRNQLTTRNSQGLATLKKASTVEISEMLQVAIREDNSKALTIIAHKLHCNDIVVAQMNKNLPTLHGMYLDNPTGAMDLIMFLLINVTEYYNIGKTMNATQIEELAVILCENFRNWTLSDFITSSG